MNNKIYEVTNRSGSQVVYRIPELNNLRRQFAPGETKKITLEELEKLSYIPGGASLLVNFLMVGEEVFEKLNMPKQEPEYYYSEQEIADIMKNGSLNKFLDTLDFATVGRIELIKDLAVKLPLTDTQKIAALKEKTGFDVIKALEHMKEDVPAAKTDAPVRREAPEAPAAPQRREPSNSLNSITPPQK